MRCPRECNGGSPHCLNRQYKDRANLDDVFDTIVRLEIDMGIMMIELNPNLRTHLFAISTCPSCAAVVTHLLQYLDSPSPFPALTCLYVSLQTKFFLHSNRDRCKDILARSEEILARLFGSPRLRHVVFSDPLVSGPLPLPPVPSNLAVELDPDLEETRLKSYLAILDPVRVSNFIEIPPAMLVRWAPSLQRLMIVVRRTILEVGSKFGSDFPKF